MTTTDRIALDLVGHDLRIRFSVTDGASVTAVAARPRGRDSVVRVSLQPADEPQFSHEAVLDLRQLVAHRQPGDRRYDLLLEDATDAGTPPVTARLGRAPDTERPFRALQAQFDGVAVRVEVTDHGNFTVAVREELPPAKPRLTPLAFRPLGSQLEVAFATQGDTAITEAALEFVERTTGTRVTAPLKVTADRAATRRANGHLCHTISGTVDLAGVDAELPRGDGVIALHVLLTDEHGERHRPRFKLPHDDKRSSLRPMTVVAERHASHYVPYLTFKGSCVSLRVDKFDPEAFGYFRRLLRWAWLMPLLRRVAGVWLVGELPDRAQDNGYHFFRWVRRNHPSKRVYYVMTADSPDRRRVEELGNVIVRGSRKHMLYSLLATRLISTHHPEYLLPTHDRRMVRWAKGTRVFLQHGIMGTKNMVANYGRQADGFRTDRFHVSSAREREMIINDFGYRPRQVRVTGLPRFDTLLAPGAEPHGILIIPTWREWLLNPSYLAGSEFLERWRAVLHHEQTARLLAAGERITFILHPNMGRHVDMFDAPDGVTVLRQGERDVQSLLREHRALITDYSSVGFDFALQERPVFYFQFDRDTFLGKFPSHLDPVLDLPGYVASREDELLAEVAAGRDAGFPMPDEYRARARSYFDFGDRESSRRVYRSVKRFGGPGVLVARLRDSGGAARVFARFRRSRVYRPAMRGLMGLARALPRSHTVVFESGNGRQYGGNPRAVYEELVRRDTSLRCVWVTTSTFRPADTRTRKVEPGTPRFYWELGRARYWVSDQNLGIDVRPSRRTFYLQTWHGTPLKRMQHDALSHQGRAPGYLERVTVQTGYWSCLLSPSPYATERFRTAFRYRGEVLEVGYPRNDVLAGAALEERKQATRARLEVPPDQRMVLFAPTFRDNVKRRGRFAFDPGFDFTELVPELPDDMLLLVRAHHVVGQHVMLPHRVRDRVIDVTRYDDAQDLLAAADVLVTDYSSMMFDFALTQRPMLFFCPDLVEYGTQLRGFYFDFEREAPGPILRSTGELAAALHDLDGVSAAHREQLAAFAASYGPLDDGHAAERVVDDLLAR